MTPLDKLEQAVARCELGLAPLPERPNYRRALLMILLAALVGWLLGGCAAVPTVTAENYHVAVKWGERTELRLHSNTLRVIRRF